MITKSYFALRFFWSRVRHKNSSEENNKRFKISKFVGENGYFILLGYTTASVTNRVKNSFHSSSVDLSFILQYQS